MSLYTVLVFVHVISAIGLAAGGLISLFAQFALRQTQRVEQVRAILGLVTLSEPFVALSLVLTPTVGLILVITTWGWQNGWINVALGSMIFLLLPAGAVAGTKRRALAHLVNEMADGPIPDSLKLRIHDPLLGSAIHVMVALVLGIEFLMTTKPALEGSVVVIVTSVMIGVLASFPLWREKNRGTDRSIDAI